MFRKAISRVRAISTLDISAAKVRTQQWEPALRLPSRPHEPKPVENKDQNGPWFTTYSAFDPGCARPFLISGLSIGIKDISPKLSRPTVLVPSPSTKSVITLDKADEVKMAVEVKKPWPYRLPKALRPREGTTFAAMYEGGLESSTSPSLAAMGMKKVGILQAILYGVPEPGKKDLEGEGEGEGKEEGLWSKIMYGVKEDEEK